MSSFRKARSHKKIWKFVYAGFAVCMGLLALCALQTAWKCRQQEIEAFNELHSYRRQIYVAASHLSAGTVITQEDVCLSERYLDCDKELFITESDFGKTLLYEVAEGGCLFKSMLSDTQESVREVFFTECKSTGMLEIGDRIDIRIRYSNAEDYLVLSDKWLVACEENGMVLRLTEEEILWLASAISDYSEYRGTILYAAKYPGDGNMTAMKQIYIPRIEILEMLHQKSTKGELRAALEARLNEKNHE